MTRDREILRRCGIDTRGLSAAEIAKGAKLAARVGREDCGLRGCVRDRSNVLAEWQAFLSRVAAAKKPRSADRHREPNRDRHAPGYMRDYMRRRRAAQKNSHQTNI